MYYNLTKNYSPTGKTSTVVIEDSDKEKYDLYSEKGKLGNWQKEFINFPDKLHMMPDLHEYSREEFLFQDILRWQRAATTIVVSKKLKTLFEKFIIQSHKFYDVEVNANGRVEEYYILHMLNLYDYIDYSKSVFAVRLRKTNEIIKYKKGEVRDYEHFKELGKQIREKYLHALKISYRWGLSHAFMSSYYDIFRGTFPYKFIITERVKEAMEAAGITGARYEEVKKYTIEMPTMP